MLITTLAFFSALGSSDPVPSAGPRTMLVAPIESTQSDVGASVALAGELTLVSGYTRNARHEDDALLLALDALGRVAWRTTLPGGGDAALWSVRALDDGGSIAAGWTKTARGDRDALLARFDSKGGALWTRSYGSERDERLWSLELTAEGFVAAGESAAGDRTSGLYLSTDREGRELALRTPGEAEVERMFAVQPLEDGRYVLAGMAGSGPRESQGYDARITCYDAGGELVWNRTFGGNDFDVAHDVRRATDGGLAVLGYSMKGASRAADAFLLSLSLAGELRWERSYGGAGDDRAVHLASLASGGFAFVGYTRESARDSDVVVRATNAAGELAWERRFGGRGDELGRSIAEAKSGALTIVGHSRSYGEGEHVLLIRLEPEV